MYVPHYLQEKISDQRRRDLHAEARLISAAREAWRGGSHDGLRPIARATPARAGRAPAPRGRARRWVDDAYVVPFHVPAWRRATASLGRSLVSVGRRLERVGRAA